MSEPGFTDAVRQELSGLPLGGDDEQAAELAALVRLAGTVTVHGGGGGVSLELATTSGAVTRRAFALLHARLGERPELLVRRPGGLRPRVTYGVRHRLAGLTHARALGLGGVDDEPAALVPEQGPALLAFARGALLATGSVSAPGRPPHLEITVGDRGLAERLAARLAVAIDARLHATPEPRARVVCKSGQAVGAVLAALGATRAFLAYDEQRLRRQLRGDATRLANADSANLRRSIEAAGGQVAAVERAVERHGWDGIDEELREIALARLANPSASLSELGQLVDPPQGKSTVHRRLRRLERLAEQEDDRTG